MIIKPKQITKEPLSFGQKWFGIGWWSHYENGRPETGIQTLRIKVGKKKKLIKGRIYERVHDSRNALADYLYEYTFLPNNKRGEEILEQKVNPNES